MQRLDTLGHQLAFAARRAVESRQRLLVQTSERLGRAREAATSTHRQGLDRLALRMQALDPKRVLARGYAWLTDGEGTPVSSVERMAVGAELTAVLVDGSAVVAVTRLRRDGPLS